ncbi:MAG TPA: alpha/beta fold hydrolase [Sphingomicrobium sp.]|nr:alpha/beta fold hydrolase [Sphingomicrobium sp.]
MRFRMMVALCLLAGTASGALGEVMPLDQAAKRFGIRESAKQADLSPSGRKIVYLAAGAGAQTIAKVYDLDTKKTVSLIASSGNPETLRWCEFATETQLICRYSGNAEVEGVLLGFSRLATLSLVGKDVRSLGSKRAGYDMYIRQNDGAVLDWLPDAEGSVLMSRTYVPKVEERATNIKDERLGLGVDRVELATLRSRPVEEPRRQASHYMTDGRGNVRIMGEAESDNVGQLKGITTFRFRKAGKREWERLGAYNSQDDVGMWPVAIEQSTDSVYILEDLNGRDALYRMPLDGSGAKTLIAKNDYVDIDGVVRIDRGLPVIGYSYTDDRGRTVYFDPEFKKLASALGRALPQTPMIEFAAASRDAKTLLVHASSDTDPGAYYVLNRTTKQMEPVLLSRELVQPDQLAPVKSISYPAADGKMIPAYLTMSKDGPAKGRPAVILPHGGPSSRDSWGFDWLAQFLAARGYAVIQPNYRGSAGYGDEFLGENAFRDWKTAMSDISDSGKYLVAQGIADPGKLAILGWSYGGYAALQSASLEPDRYKAVIAIAPVTDLAMLKRDYYEFTSSKLARETIGSGEHLKPGSPLQNASRIKAPVLLVHGDMDINVRSRHSAEMAEALREARRPVEFVRHKELDHYLDDSNARTEMLIKIGQLLDRTIGKQVSGESAGLAP